MASPAGRAIISLPTYYNTLFRQKPEGGAHRRSTGKADYLTLGGLFLIFSRNCCKFQTRMWLSRDREGFNEPSGIATLKRRRLHTPAGSGCRPHSPTSPTSTASTLDHCFGRQHSRGRSLVCFGGGEERCRGMLSRHVVGDDQGKFQMPINSQAPEGGPVSPCSSRPGSLCDLAMAAFPAPNHRGVSKAKPLHVSH